VSINRIFIDISRFDVDSIDTSAKPVDIS